MLETSLPTLTLEVLIVLVLNTHDPDPRLLIIGALNARHYI